MLTNDDCGGLHPDKRQMNINFKDNTYPKTMGRYCPFLILVINYSTMYYKYAVDIFFILSKSGNITCFVLILVEKFYGFASKF